MFEVRCPGCQNPFELDERRVPRNGMTMRCPKCQTTFVVKRPDTVAFGGAPPPVPAAVAKSPGQTGPVPSPTMPFQQAVQMAPPSATNVSSPRLPLPPDLMPPDAPRNWH